MREEEERERVGECRLIVNIDSTLTFSVDIT